jgi:molybdopterin-binding protein
VPTYRIGQAAELLGVSADTVRRWVDDGELAATRPHGGERLVDGVALAAFAAARGDEREAAGGGQSVRNRLRGIVTRVVRDKVTAQVELQAGPHRIVSVITREAADELGLAPGVIASAVVKATNVGVEVADG